MINDGADEIQTYYNDFCSNIENQYLYKVKIERPSYFDGIYFYLDMLEDGSFCEYTFADAAIDDGFE